MKLPRMPKILSLICILVLVPAYAFSGSWQSRCDDVASRGYINVMTINLLFSEVQDRNLRLERIADYIQHSGPIDIILTQEVVGGALAQTPNSALDLQRLLAVRGINANLRYRLANGIPGLLSVGNAILSRCEVDFTLGRSLPFITEEPFQGIEVPLRRGVMMSRIAIPGYGKIDVYNTHLCAFCDPDERLSQARTLVDFINGVEDAIWWDNNPVLLGGDFNADLNNPDQRAVYSLITREGFTDTYAAANDCGPADGRDTCCPDGGCTYAVDGNPYAENNPFATGSVEEARIDYIFAEGFGHGILESLVVFNEDPNWVSDHSAVLTRLMLP